jgi:hypothetical protein
MVKKKESVYQNETTPTEILSVRPQIPADYHTTDFTENFLGEIFDVKTERYYSQNARYRYYPKQDDKHICPGHWQGYRWAIQNFTEPGDWVFDPTCGTGTTLVEAYNNGRNSIGVELEFPTIARNNIDAQTLNPEIEAILIQGDARNTVQNLESAGIKRGQLSLVINGTPYPKISGKSSDSPERKQLEKKTVLDGDQMVEKLEIKKDLTFDYQNPSNIGLTKGDEYWSLVNSMYTQSIEFLKPGGYFVILIKDMIQNKKPYLLSSMITNEVLANNPEVEYYGLYMHRHVPETMFMRTYPKMFPDVPLPAYQAGIVLRKK